MHLLYLEREGYGLTGDTVFNGGPGIRGGSYSDIATIFTSSQEKLLTLQARDYFHSAG